MIIRHADTGDLASIMEAYDTARSLMRRNGNHSQWTDGYPSRELVLLSVESRKQFVCIRDGELAGTFYFSVETEPTYRAIYEGQWLDDEPYGVIHRLASNGKYRGVADAVFRWCLDRCGNVRVDTHRDNIAMRNILQKHGFSHCGIILLENGAERMAYQKKIVTGLCRP